MTAVLSTVDLDDASLVHKARTAPKIVGRDLVREVMPAKAFAWGEGLANNPLTAHVLAPHNADRHVVALDYGMKWNILRCLTQVGCEVTVVPGTATAARGAGPRTRRHLPLQRPRRSRTADLRHRDDSHVGRQKPIFGICLGQQLLGLAYGAKTFKLKFGHRGANQPVLNRRTGHVEITTQNHGFAVDADTLPPDVEATHINLNDGTLEGMRHKTKPVFSVQYHPESSAGPHDSTYLFEEFRRLMD